MPPIVDYDSIRGGVPSVGLPYQPAGLANFSIEKFVSINIGGTGTTNSVTLTLDQVMASEVVVTNGGSGVTTINWPGAMPGHYFVAYNNTGAAQGCVFKVAGQTGITVADGKRALLVCEATDIVRVTADT